MFIYNEYSPIRPQDVFKEGYMKFVCMMMILLLMPLSGFADTGFPALARAHFRSAEVCLKQSKIPTRAEAEIIIEALNNAAKQYWSDDPTYAAIMGLALLLTEGGGNSATNKADPVRRAYGPLHIKYDEALTATKKYNIKAPDVSKPGGEEWFRAKLDGSPSFSIQCAMAYYRICYDIAVKTTAPDGDQKEGHFAVAACIYKYGINGYNSLPNVYNTPTFEHYLKIYNWLICVGNTTLIEEREVEDICYECLHLL